MKMLEDLDKATAGWSDVDCYNFVRTHHATIRDMAARLEAAQRDVARLRNAICVHRDQFPDEALDGDIALWSHVEAMQETGR